MNFMDAFVILFIIFAVAAAGLYFFNKWAASRMGEQQVAIERNKQSVTIFVIDKSSGRIKNANLPKAVTEQMPWYAKALKMYFVKAKAGPQIVTLLCDKNVYEALPTKKNVRVDLAGIYITGMKGMKTKQEMKEIAKAKKAAKE